MQTVHYFGCLFSNQKMLWNEEGRSSIPRLHSVMPKDIIQDVLILFVAPWEEVEDRWLSIY